MDISVIEDLLLTLPAYPNNTGLVVGISKGGHNSIFGFGDLSDTNPELPGGNTLFEVGSISKIFTTSLLSIAVVDGRLNLEDSVRDREPQLAHWPPALTLLQLATHTSGLPKMPSNLIRSALRDWRNPHANYSITDLYKFLVRYKPKTRLPAQVSYSNLGMALLGFILARVLGSSYEQVVVDQIGAPLGLSDTRIALSADQHKRLAPPHSAKGKPGINWDSPAFAGAGGLLSTANDLLGFLSANMGHSRTPLMQALEACHAMHTSDFAPLGFLQKSMLKFTKSEPDQVDYRHGMTLGWMVGRLHSTGEPFLWHHGATGGYRAFVGFARDASTGVVVLANSGLGLVDALRNTTATDSIGFEVLEHFNS